ERLLVDQGGAVRPSAEVARITPGLGSRAAGVELASGEKITAAKGVICSTGPEQLYNGLLKDWPIPAPAEVRRGLKAFRHGKGDMQIHYALKGGPRWRGDPDLAKVALIHLTSGLDGVSRAANEAERGLLPAEPTICVGQPTALDPSRAPPGAAPVRLQRPAAPRPGRPRRPQVAAGPRRCARPTPTGSSGGSPRISRTGRRSSSLAGRIR